MCAAFTRNWSEASPTDNDYAYDLDDYMRYIRVDVSDRLKDMIYGFTAGENDGLMGFKELTFKQQVAASGTPNADEIVLYSIDDGADAGLYAKQEDGYSKQILKKDGTNLILNLDDNDNVVLKTTNQTITGDKTFSGITTLTTVNGSISGTAIADEDDMASNSATKVPTQQSTKAYVDAKETTVNAKLLISDTTEFTTSNLSTNVASPDTLDFTSVIGANRAFIIAMVKNHESGNRYLYWHPSGDGGGDSGDYWDYNNIQHNVVYCETINDWTIAYIVTGTNGTIKCWGGFNSDFTIKLIGYMLFQ